MQAPPISGLLSEPGERQRFADWMAKRTTGAAVDPQAFVVRRPVGGGWSNETVIVSLSPGQSVVLRVQPKGAAMFPHYDLGREYRLLRALSDHASIPTPPLVGEDLAGAVLGRPAFVMHFVAGQIPSDDRPSFAEAGWLHAAPATVQRRFHEHMLAALVMLHQLPVAPFVPLLAAADSGALLGSEELGSEELGSEELGSAELGSGALGSNELLVPLADLAAVWQWDRGDVWPAVIREGFQFLRAHCPPTTQTSLLWGDARPANVIVGEDGYSLRALLDWELSSIGPPALDLAWLLEMNWMRTVGAGVAVLPGFLSDAAALKYYEQLAGVQLQNMRWFRCFSALKMAVLMHRFLRVSVHRGQLRPQHHVLGNTVASRRLQALLASLT